MGLPASSACRASSSLCEAPPSSPITLNNSALSRVPDTLAVPAADSFGLVCMHAPPADILWVPASPLSPSHASAPLESTCVPSVQTANGAPFPALLPAASDAMSAESRACICAPLSACSRRDFAPPETSTSPGRDDDDCDAGGAGSTGGDGGGSSGCALCCGARGSSAGPRGMYMSEPLRFLARRSISVRATLPRIGWIPLRQTRKETTWKAQAQVGERD
eukprot:849976-Pleurochrysis_carterae.AAC.1